jgi:Phage integrase family
MARAIRSAKLENRTARLKLVMRKKPYFVTVSPRIALGYRRNQGAGTWVVRAADGHGSNWTKAFAVADDHEDANGASVLTFWQAQDKARALARAGEGNGDRPATVGEAIDAYAADLAARGAHPDNGASLRFNVPDTLAAKAVALLTEKELRTWRNSLVKRGLKPASADRVGRVFKACLNLAAADDPRIVNAGAWRNGLTRLPDGESARNVILSDETVRAVIAAAYTDSQDYGLFIEALAGTGARESQLLRLDVTDLLDSGVAPRLLLPNSRKGKNRRVERRPIAISPRLARVLRQAAGGRTARLFDRVPKIAQRFRAVTKHLHLDPATTPYALRHSSIVRMLLASVPTRVVAAHHDTSVAMIEKHYARYIVGDPSDAMTRRTLIDFGAPPPSDNIVPITGR